MSGWEVARQIREAAAAFPVVYMTGASGGPVDFARGSQQHPAAQALRAAQLVTAVSQLLNAPPA
jgi:CheY-like chemotaxis protein